MLAISISHFHASKIGFKKYTLPVDIELQYVRIRRYWPNDAPSKACSFSVWYIVHAWYDLHHLVSFGTIATDQEGDGNGWTIIRDGGCTNYFQGRILLGVGIS